MIWCPFFARVKVNHRRVYSRILGKVCAVAMAMGWLKQGLKIGLCLFKKSAVIRISRDLVKIKIRNHVNDLSQKIWILTWGIFNTTANDLWRIMKIASVKILLEQCWQKGFHVNSLWSKDKKDLTSGFFWINKNHF